MPGSIIHVLYHAGLTMSSAGSDVTAGVSTSMRLFFLLAAGAVCSVLLAACKQEEAKTYQGYVEGEFLYLASPQAGYLERLVVPRGQRVSLGQPVFSISSEPDLQALKQAEAQAAAARERVQNLKAPRRQPEIGALAAQLNAAEAALRLSEAQLKRQQQLVAQHFIADAQVDEARAVRDRDAAQSASIRQQIATYRASIGRQAEVSGAEADVLAATAQVEQKRWQVERKSVAAPAEGEISDTYYRAGEWVPAGAPVASLLPDARRRLRFFVPETVVGKLKPGQAILAHCDGCTQPISAHVDFIATEAEYTPPVIYSRGSREKLVFRVEAVPDGAQALSLRPGLPADIEIKGQ